MHYFYATTIAFDTNSLFTATFTAVLKGTVRLLDGASSVLDIDSSLFKLGHGYYLRLGCDVVC